MTWEPVIGIEIHVQLRTSAKLFCGNAAVFGDEPNKHVCPVCLGLPGALPTTNPEAVALHDDVARAVRLGDVALAQASMTWIIDEAADALASGR